MAKISKNVTLNEYQGFIFSVYGFPDDRHFTTNDMLVNIQRFLMRGLKGIRKDDIEKTKFNLLISLSWTMSLLNRLHVKIEDEVWHRFPYVCSHCGVCPCLCDKKGAKKRKKIKINNKLKPKKIQKFQEMFEKIYPSNKRNLENAGIHLAEELGELSEAILAYRGSHSEKDFNNIKLEAADLISCLFAAFNSMGLDLAEELSVMFTNNCHECKKSPCICNFRDIVNFRS